MEEGTGPEASLQYEPPNVSGHGSIYVQTDKWGLKCVQPEARLWKIIPKFTCVNYKWQISSSFPIQNGRRPLSKIYPIMQHRQIEIHYFTFLY